MLDALFIFLSKYANYYYNNFRHNNKTTVNHSQLESNTQNLYWAQ